MEHERCYVYVPPEADERPSKRQRIEKTYPYALCSERLDTFRKIWTEQEERIQVGRLKL
jgi:origin recognition complex subunit 3